MKPRNAAVIRKLRFIRWITAHIRTDTGSRFGGSNAEGRFMDEQMVAIIREADREPGIGGGEAAWDQQR
jgi:hypothetical protein